MERRAFTMIELLVVMAVILSLVGIGFPVMAAIQARQRISATRGLVAAVAAAISQYPVREWPVQVRNPNDTDADGDGLVDGTLNRVRIKTYSGRIFDLNVRQSPSPDFATGDGAMTGDGFLDGTPGIAVPPATGATLDGPFWGELVDSGYGGFLACTHAPVPRQNIDRQGRVVDAWKRPLRIEWSALYGSDGVGIWSMGKDGIDRNEDDLTSWKDHR